MNTKPLKLTSKSLFAVALLFGIAAFGTVSATSPATARGGATKLVEFTQGAPTVDKAPRQVTENPSLCPDCKWVTASYITQDTKLRTKTLSGAKHLCAACKTELPSIGHGKAKSQSIKHSCKTTQMASGDCCGAKK